MEKEFALYPEALDLKELGFDGPCFGYFESQDKNLVINYNNTPLTEEQQKRPGLYAIDNRNSILPQWAIAAPTYSQAFRWFREKYGLWFRPDYYDELKEYNFQGSIHELGKYSAVADIGNHKTPEEAELECLKKLIEIVKSK